MRKQKLSGRCFFRIVDCSFKLSFNLFFDHQRLEVLRRNYKFKAGQYAFIKIKELGNEKHPFTIASSPIENTVTFFIKVAGDWTESLYQLLEERKSSKNPKQIECILTG